MNEYTQSLLRHLLTSAGGALVAKGVTDQGTVELISGGLVALLGLVLSLWHKRQVNTLKAQVEADAGAPGTATNVRSESGTIGVKLWALVLGAGLSLALLGSGCRHPQLEPGGAYAPTDANGVATAKADYDLFVADSAFALAVDGATAVFRFERDNRATLWKISPAIKHSLDQVRAEATAVKVQYATARTAYLANPVPANLSALYQLLVKAQQLTAAAQAVLANPGASNAPPGAPVVPAAPAPAATIAPVAH